MRFGWVVSAFGLLAVLIAQAGCATAQTFDPSLDEPELDLPAPPSFDLGAVTPLDIASADANDDEGLTGDLPAGRSNFSPLADLAADRFSGGQHASLLFGGYDLWRNGASLYGGFEWFGGGTAENGPVVRLMASEALERYQTGRFIYINDISRASVLAGWRFKSGAFELKILAGPDLENRASMPDYREQRWRGTHGGVRIAVESWAEPTPETMLSSSFYASTIAGSYGARLAAGWRMFDAFWVGPEMSGSSDEFSQQTRIGIHLTGFEMAAMEWSAAAGYVRDSYGRSGIYSRLGASLRR
ncbi:cellulose biosynthesis protein BcsS [Rhodopseudomonas sp. G2_2311]|uniref:cellulose biosynthesis protein BcsS n=1 Tax=Rhodopseudomonas sp. G2_2311 TaxID=3114287 RepID=UPI0039C652D4